MRMGNCKYQDLVRFNGVDDAIGKFLDPVASAIRAELSPSLRMSFDATYRRIDLVSKTRAKTRPYAFVITDCVAQFGPSGREEASIQLRPSALNTSSAGTASISPSR